MPDKYLTISSLTRYLKFKFDSDENLRNVYLRGEISNFKSHTTGHYYFSLKDETSKINAIMFKNNTLKLNLSPLHLVLWYFSFLPYNLPFSVFEYLSLIRISFLQPHLN